MKKIMIFMVATLLLVSCCKTKTSQEIDSTMNNLYIKGYPKIKIVEFGYNGHDYIMFEKQYGYFSMSIIHNPDCNCQTKK